MQSKMHNICTFVPFILFAALVAFGARVPITNAINQNAHSALVASDECIIQTVHFMPKNKGEDESNATGDEEIRHFRHINFLCEVTSVDDDGILNTKMLQIKLSHSQKKAMMEKFESGELVSNVSTLSLGLLGESIDIVGNDIHVSPEADVVTALGSGDDTHMQAPSFIGDKHVLAVKVTDSKGRAVDRCAAQIGDDIFGTRGDPVNLRSQMYLCSYGQFRVIAGDPPTNSAGEYELAPGVIEVTIDVDLKETLYYDIEKAATEAVGKKLGFELPGPYDHVMFILEGCYLDDNGNPVEDCEWAAYGRHNHWLTVYQGGNSQYASVLVHEIGHNLDLQHSKNKDGSKTYGDNTCVMGAGAKEFYSDDIGKICFNGAKSWQLGWYESNTHTFKASDRSWRGTIVGVADYKNNPNNSPVVIKLETGLDDDYYITFNRATGINSDNGEANDMVTIVKSGPLDRKSYSYMWSQLGEGKQKKFEDFGGTGRNLIVRVLGITFSSFPVYAEVQICFGKCREPKQ